MSLFQLSFFLFHSKTHFLYQSISKNRNLLNCSKKKVLSWYRSSFFLFRIFTLITPRNFCRPKWHVCMIGRNREEKREKRREKRKEKRENKNFSLSSNPLVDCDRDEHFSLMSEVFFGWSLPLITHIKFFFSQNNFPLFFPFFTLFDPFTHVSYSHN